MSLFPLVEDYSPKSVSVEPEGVIYAFGSTTSSGITINDKKKCQLCKNEDWVYRCPGCDFKSCSLSCINQHKSRFDCNGKRKMTEFLTRKQVTSEALTQDYNYLCEVTRIAENSERDLKGHDMNKERVQFKKGSILAREMKKHQINIITTSFGLSRARQNMSHWNAKKKTGMWSLEIQINPVQAEPFKTIFHSFNGERSLAQMFQTYVLDNMPTDDQLVFTDPLREFLAKNKDDVFFHSPSDTLHYFMPTRSSKPNSPTYYILNPNISFQEALKQTEFYDFPSILIYSEKPSNFSTHDAEPSIPACSSEESSESESEESSSSESSCQNEDEIDLDDL